MLQAIVTHQHLYVAVQAERLDRVERHHGGRAGGARPVGGAEAAQALVRRWLAANGSLIVAEHYPDWSADFLAGLYTHWWHQAAGEETPYSSLVPATAWAVLLRAEGFEDVLDFHEPAADGLSEGAFLLLARSPAQGGAALPLPEPASWSPGWV